MKTTHPAAYAKTRVKRSAQPNPYAICTVRKGKGVVAVLVNASTGPSYDIVTHTCPKCGIVEYKTGISRRVTYAHKRYSGQCCDECHGDRVAMVGMALERELGINLGWGVGEHSREYERESYGYKARYSLQQDAKEV